jgi:hypothetical protein
MASGLRRIKGEDNCSISLREEDWLCVGIYWQDFAGLFFWSQWGHKLQRRKIAPPTKRIRTPQKRRLTRLKR